MRLFVMRVSNIMSYVAGITLLMMVIITLADVIMRLMGSPIPGVYEIISYLGVVVAGFAMPRASMMKTHVNVDIVFVKLSKRGQVICNIFTRLLVFAFFLITAWYFVKMGRSFVAAREVSMTLRIPFYPIAFGMVICCLGQCLATITEIFEQEGDAK